MKNLIHTAVVTLFAASAAHAQQAVQWKVSDGGNGHWYGVVAGSGGCWTQHRQLAEQVGGHLVTLTTASESAFVESLTTAEFLSIGGIQLPDACEPECGWTWITGEPWIYTRWDSGQPEDFWGQNGGQDLLVRTTNGWHDASECPPYAGSGYIVEWSADCNNDGIVDYGQCHDGTLPDYNGNNIPDCCERGEACVLGNYPVQWRASDGGNGHWYEVHVFDRPTRWLDARAAAQALGGDLASLESAGEPGFVDRLAGNPVGWGSRIGPWLGGFQDTSAGDFAEPAGGWRWTSGAPWQFTAWGPGEPNDSPSPENFLHFISNNCPGYPDGRFYNDVRGDFGYIGPCDKMPIGAIIEWSTDCNNDGVVDKGQILMDQLVDANADGIPDICQQPTCADADIYRDFNVNGADLGILLSQWGLNTPLTESDLNGDGVVNGADLGFLLANWGPCPG